jgi:hypothetical protein
MLQLLRGCSYECRGILPPGPMTSTELARHLSDAASSYRASGDGLSLAQLESLTRDAVAHVHRVGEGTVDHIVLASVLTVIASDVPSVAQVLREEGWHWLR